MSSDPFGSFEDAFEQGAGAVAAAVKKQVSDTASTTVSQLGLASSDTSGAPDVKSNVTSQSNPQSPHDPVQNAPNTHATEERNEIENQQKLQETRAMLREHQSLHKKNYFDPTFNPPKREEPVAQKLEKEKQQEEQKKMQELEDQRKKDEPIALSRAKRSTEMNRGAGG